MTPATYGAGGRGAQIEFRAVPCSLGWLMVGRTDRGICSLTLGDDPDATSCVAGRGVSRGRAGRSRTKRCPNSATDWSAWPTAARTGWTCRSRWWRRTSSGGSGGPCGRIPRGETRSYSELAELAGSPKAVRAAASACANNRVSLLIPCHRVVRADGSTGHYAWGAERKVKLLRGRGEGGSTRRTDRSAERGTQASGWRGIRRSVAHQSAEQQGGEDGAEPVEADHHEDDAGKAGQSGTEDGSRDVQVQHSRGEGGAEQPGGRTREPAPGLEERLRQQDGRARSKPPPRRAAGSGRS